MSDLILNIRIPVLMYIFLLSLKQKLIKYQ